MLQGGKDVCNLPIDGTELVATNPGIIWMSDIGREQVKTENFFNLFHQCINSFGDRSSNTVNFYDQVNQVNISKLARFNFTVLDENCD